MTASTALAAEQLVYDIALDELNLSDDDVARVDVAKIVDDALRGIRIALARHRYDRNPTEAGYRQLVREYLLPDPKVIDLRDALRRIAERDARRKPVS